MDGGHRAVIFDRFSGIKKFVVGEGTHFFIPWVQKPVIFDIRARPRNVPVITASKGILFDHFFIESYFLAMMKTTKVFDDDIQICKMLISP